MADIFVKVSNTAFVLAVVCVVVAVALFFALNTKAAYLELKGQPQKKWLQSSRGKSKRKAVLKAGKVQETSANKSEVEEEAPTTLDNGEVVTTVSLVNVYEPGTDIIEEDTESVTEIETNPGLVHDFYEEIKTAPVKVQEEASFKVTKKVVIVHSNELLR